jgi:gamma-glutamyltranspeptidase/glutathione hydrolase
VVPFTTRPELKGTFGMVASTHWLASAAGMAVLERGGNAFDAAVAAGFTLQVVEPHQNGPGGDMPAILYDSARRQAHVVCGQGTAPAAATLEHVRGLGLDEVPGTGLLPACVPGAFGGWLLILERFGTWSLADVLEFAIGYAERGFPLLPAACELIAAAEALFCEEWTESGRIWLSGDGAPAPGSRFRNPKLAATFRRIVRGAGAVSGREAQIEAARREWYQGFVAEAIDRCSRDEEVLEVTGGRHRGLLRGQDMACWRASLEPPVAFDYGEWRVLKTGPWGQGPVFLQQLALLRHLDLGAMRPGSADFVHTVTECAKLAFADREAWYGDPDFADDLTRDLLDDAYNDVRSGLVGDRASRELRPGRPGGREPRVPVRDVRLATPEASPRSGPEVATRGSAPGDTCHVDVADRWGNLISATPSGGWLQSSPAIPGLGFCLGTRAQIFNLEPGHPNSLAPGKRPRTTLSPSLAYWRGRPHLAFGTPGADQQDQWSLNFFLAVVHCGHDLQQAIEVPMFHTEHFPRSFSPHHCHPGSVVVEERAGAEVVAELRRRGHDVQVRPDWSLGRVTAVADDQQGGLLRAAASPHHVQAYAVGR